MMCSSLIVYYLDALMCVLRWMNVLLNEVNILISIVGFMMFIEKNKLNKMQINSKEHVLAMRKCSHVCILKL